MSELEPAVHCTLAIYAVRRRPFGWGCLSGLPATAHFPGT